MAYEDIAADLTIDNVTKVIDYVGTAHGAAAAGYYTGIYFHRWLQDLADDQQSVIADGDYMDMTKLTPSSRNGIDQIIEVLNGYTITQDLSEHLYECSIIQAGGDDIWDGMTLIASEGCDLQIHQDGSLVTNDFWNSIPDGESEKGLNRDVANGIAAKFLLKVKTAGTEIDGRKIIGQTRVWGYTYSEFKVNGTARGNNVIALNYTVDNNNQTAQGTIQALVDITNTPGYTGIDINADSTDEYYYSYWDINKGTNSINTAYEFWKEITSQGNTDSFYGLDGELFRGITHQIAYTVLDIAVDHSNPVVFSGGAVMQCISSDGLTGTGVLWFQLITGTAPVTSETFTQVSSSCTGTVGVVTERPLSFPFCGASTGSALLGGYGHGMLTSEVTNNDKLIALDNIQRTPPNNQNFYVNGVVVGEDYILVGPQNGGATDIDYAQFAINADPAQGATVVLKASNETPGTGTDSELDTPATGTIRVLGDDGILHRVAYTGYSSGSGLITFTGCTGTPDAAIDNDACISYIDVLAAATTESFAATFSTTRTLFGRVRDGKSTPIKTFEAKNASFGSAGGSISVSRSSDE